jgi:hypothetical protein
MYKLKIPKIEDDKAELYYEDKLVGYVNLVQALTIRNDIKKYIRKTGDRSILDKIYLIGHDYSFININNMGKNKIKITLNDNCDFSTNCWEFGQVGRLACEFIQLEKEDRKCAASKPSLKPMKMAKP